MTFRIFKSSDTWQHVSKEAPCKGAVPTIPDEEFKREQGIDYCDIKDDDRVWHIEINTIEELIQVIKDCGSDEVVVGKEYMWDTGKRADKYFIEIYDTWRE